MRQERQRGPRRAWPDQQRKLLCTGCRSEGPTTLVGMNHSDGMLGGVFPLCRTCHAQYSALGTTAELDSFVNCLAEELTRQVRGW